MMWEKIGNSGLCVFEAIMKNIIPSIPKGEKIYEELEKHNEILNRNTDGLVTVLNWIAGDVEKTSEHLESISLDISNTLPVLEQIADGIDRHTEVLSEIAKAIIK